MARSNKSRRRRNSKKSIEKQIIIMNLIKKYESKIQSLKNLQQSGSLVASRHFCQLEKALQEYYSSPKNDSPSSTFFNFPPIQIKISEIEHYLSSFSKQELKNPPKRITPSQQPNYPPLSPEDLL
ncbi:MAG: hypothetical protein ABH840_02265, partial [Nanoarchaeota archaeon]